MSNSIEMDLGFRWLDDVTIELAGERPNVDLQLKIRADIEKKYTIGKSRERTIIRDSDEKIPCDKCKVVEIELFECKRKYGVSKRKVLMLSMTIPLRDHELYTEETYLSDDDRATLKLSFAYSLGGELRERVENARKITLEQKVVLDKVRHLHRFFHSLETVCEAIEDIHPYIKVASTAILSLYKIFERQKDSRDAARALVDDMSDLLIYGIEEFSDVLRVNSNTRTAFKSVADTIEEITDLIADNNTGMVKGQARDTLSTSYMSKIEEMREKLRKAKTGLNDSITYGIWEMAMDDKLRSELKSISSAHYKRGAGCLPNTRVVLLATVDTWVRGSSAEKIAWIHGYAGSGKSALLNSIARNLEKAYIPFTCFNCKRDDAERSDVQHILPTISYDLTRRYGDYRGTVSNIAKQAEGRSITTGDIASQMELLFGESPSYGVISPRRARRPLVHVILIDALDECKDIRERSALARHLRDLANHVPWIKVIITSRREPDIADVLADTAQPIYHIDINSDEWKTPDDIRLFIEHKANELKMDLSSDQVDRLNDKASGLFIWAITVFRYVEKRKRPGVIFDFLHSPSHTYDKPFSSLYALYQQVLDSAAEDEEDESLMSLVLSIVFVSSTRQPLSANAITSILFPNEQSGRLREKKIWVDNIVQSLFAVIYIEEVTGVIRTCHPSVLDFIGIMLNGGPSEINIKPFPVSLEEVHIRAFNNCFTIMNRTLKFNICELESTFQLNKDVLDLSARVTQHISEALRYGCLNWVSHLEQTGSEKCSGQVFSFLNSPLALFWLESLSLLNVIDRGIRILQDCASFFSEQGQPDTSKLASEWERFLLTYGDAMQSTPHLYLSALSWLPGSSQLRNILEGSFSSELPLVSNVSKTWGAEKWSESIGTMVESVAYSADGRLFAAGCRDGSVRIWDARSGKRERGPFMTRSNVWTIAFSPDGRWLASGHTDTNVRLWNLRSDSADVRILAGHTWEVHTLAFSLSGKRIISGSWDHTIRMWDVDSGTEVGIPFKGHDNPVFSATFSKDDERIISGSYGETVYIWNAETGERIVELKGHSATVYAVTCSRDGRLIASGSKDKTVRLWDAQTYEPIGDPLRGHTDEVISVCFSADNKYVASGSDDYKIRVWSVETGSFVYKMEGHTSNVRTASFSPDCRNILSGSWDGTIRIWDLEEAVSSIESSEVQSDSELCVSYVPNSELFASGSRDGNISLWNIRTGVIVGRALQGHASAINTIAVSSDGGWLVSGSFGGTLQIWDITTGIRPGKDIPGHTQAVNSITISPANQLIASASDDGTVRLWSMATCKLVMALDGHRGRVTSVAFSVDGKRLVTGGDAVRIRDIPTGKVLLEGQSNWVEDVAVSPDGNWVVSASSDFTSRIWDKSLSEIRVLEGHSEPVISATFSPNSRYLITCSYDMTIRVWDVKTGRAIGKPLKGHINAVRSVAFSPDGHEFISCSDDGTIRIWDIRTRTDLEFYKEGSVDYSAIREEELCIRWNAGCAYMDENDGWVRDGDKLLLWIPLHYRHDIKGGARLVTGAHGRDKIRPKVDYQQLFKFSGTHWRKIC